MASHRIVQCGVESNHIKHHWHTPWSPGSRMWELVECDGIDGGEYINDSDIEIVRYERDKLLVENRQLKSILSDVISSVDKISNKLVKNGRLK